MRMQCALRRSEGQNRVVPTACAFCGSAAPLTREHVFGQWVRKLGLDDSPAEHVAGPLNRLPRHMGLQPPYRQTVKSFCASCNNGWMSQLEVVAQRVLSPFILGESGTIAIEDQATIALWTQKTALTAMLISSEEQRAAGYGLPQTEYTALYERRDGIKISGSGQFWIGRYQGTLGFAGARVTPLTVRFPGFAEPDHPQGYAMTIVLGELLLHGMRFTTPGLDIDVTNELKMAQLWPSHALVSWPTGRSCTEDLYLRFAAGKMLRSTMPGVELRPWTPAAELPQSDLVDGKVRVPALCGKHVYFYPEALATAALQGRFHAFQTSCECPNAYLVQTESDGAHCKAAGTPDEISAIYEALPGEEFLLHDETGMFVCKRLPE